MDANLDATRAQAASPTRLVPAAIGAVGASAVMTQLVLLRELVGAFSGNELVMGLGLGCWLWLTGAGAWLGGVGAIGGRWPMRCFGAGLVAVALVPLLQVLAVRGLRDVVFPRGAAPGVGATVLGTAALLAPFCLASGALLTLACRLTGRTARVYLADTLGSVAGGAAFSFLLARWLDHCALLVLPALANLLLAAALAWPRRRRLAVGAAVGAALLAGSAALVDLDARSTRWQHPGEVVGRTSSPYGRLIVTRAAGQLTFYENGVPVIFSENTAEREEAVHFALSQRPDAARVLLVGGGVAGAAREVRRYGVATVTCVELDPRMIEAGRRVLPANFADPGFVEFVAADARQFIRRTAENYDVVILDLPDPSTVQLNRFFTVEFFAEVKRRLAPGGLFAFGLGRYGNFVSPELAQILASARRTAGLGFARVRMIPGERVWFLASDGPVDLDIAAALERRGLALPWVNRHYLAVALAPDRLADLERAVALPGAVNRDFQPVLCFLFLRHWLRQFSLPPGLLGVGLLAALAFSVARLAPAPRVLFASGFAASALEVVLLLVFQAGYGSLYHQVGLVVTTFMAGLAAGAWLATARAAEPAGPRRLSGLALALALVAAVLPLGVPLLADLGTVAGQGALLGVTLLIAALVGAQFPVAAGGGRSSAAPRAATLFSADLTGAAVGALVVSAWLIPVAGLTAVCLLTAGLNLAAAGLNWPWRTAA